MGRRKLHQQALYLEPDRAKLLDQLSADTRIPKAVLLREAVESLLVSHGLVEQASAVPSNVVAFQSSAKRAADRFFDNLAKELGYQDFGQLQRDVQFIKDVRTSRKSVKRRPGARSTMKAADRQSS